MPDVIRFSVPLPPPELRANSRAHWAKRKHAADEYSANVFYAFVSSLAAGLEPNTAPVPWARARVRYTWHAAGVLPDQGNIGASTKALQDILCTAPRLAPRVAMAYQRYHLGLVENDAGIEASYAVERCRHKADERVEIELERVDAEA